MEIQGTTSVIVRCTAVWCRSTWAATSCNFPSVCQIESRATNLYEFHQAAGNILPERSAHLQKKGIPAVRLGPYRQNFVANHSNRALISSTCGSNSALRMPDSVSVRLESVSR